MIRFQNVAVLAVSLVILAPLASTTAACASKSSDAAKKKKGGGAKGAAAATAKQKPGTTASGAASSGVSKGPELEGATCDGASEGVAWCDSDSTVVLCSAGTWYALDCTTIGGDVCATDVDTLTVDCYAAVDSE